MNSSLMPDPAALDDCANIIRAAWVGGDHRRAGLLADQLAATAAACGDGAALHLAAVVALERGFADMALERLEAALATATGPRTAPWWNDHGRALLKAGQPARAADSFLRTIELAPSLAPAWLNLAAAQAMQGDGEAELRVLLNGAARLRTDLSIRARVVAVLQTRPQTLPPEAETALVGLLNHPQVNPQELAPAGWLHLARAPDMAPLLRADQACADVSALAAALTARPLALALISLALPPNRTVEHLLTRLRRWLLLSGRDGDFADLCRALAAQHDLNGGAWPVPPDEAAACREADTGRLILRSYPAEATAGAPSHPHGGDVAAALRAQYETHAYPVWRRITHQQPRGFAGFCRGFRPAANAMPSNPPRVLVAGCGTGKHAAQLALAMPEARITAIDVSAASLNFARQRAHELGLASVHFEQMDLHEVGRLGPSFDHIECGGVLHHLADPEAGWRALLAALAPGATLRIALYSRIARRCVAAGRRLVADLLGGTCDDAALRAARARLLLEPADSPLAGNWGFTDFFSLAGFRDLLVNAHEDPFDIPRIARAMDLLSLRFLGFDLIDPATRARKEALFPTGNAEGDDCLADWAAFEEIYPDTFRAMYHFWCTPR